MSEFPSKPHNVYRVSFGQIIDGKLVETESQSNQIEFKPPSEGNGQMISAFPISGVVLTATFTIKKWQPNPFDSRSLPTRWYLHRKKFTSQN